MTQDLPAEISTYPIDLATRPQVTAFFDAETNTISYVVPRRPAR